MGDSWNGNKRGGGRDFKRGDRSGRDNYEGGGGYDRSESRPERKPLQWQVTETIVKGNVEIQISSAQSDRGGTLYSWSIGRAPSGDRPGMRFMNPLARKDVRLALDAFDKWCAEHGIDADEPNGNRPPGVQITKMS